MECLLRTNMRRDLQVVVRASTRKQLTCEKLIEMFEAYNRWESIFYFLGDVLLKTENNKDVHFKNIERAAEVDNLQEERGTCEASSRSLWPPSSTRCTRPATSCRPSTCVRPL